MTGYKRFENVAAAYINASEERRKAALELIPADQRANFLVGVGLYHLLTDDCFFHATCEAMGEQIYNEFNR